MFHFVIEAVTYQGKPRLHGHAMSVSDTGMGMTRRIPMSGECLFLFFFFFLTPTRLRHASGEKKNSQTLTDGLTNTIDFVIYPKTKKQV